MKFNKSTESEKWYVEADHGELLGIIYRGIIGFKFDQSAIINTNTQEMIAISRYMLTLESSYSIDTTSTFTSNSQDGQ